MDHQASLHRASPCFTKAGTQPRERQHQTWIRSAAAADLIFSCNIVFRRIYNHDEPHAFIASNVDSSKANNGNQ